MSFAAALYRGRRSVLALVAVSALVGGLTTASPPASADDSPASSAPAIPALTADRLANDIRFRTDVGLNSSESYVRSLYDDANAGRVDASVADGALLTQAEHDSLAARAKAQDPVIDAVRGYIKQQPSDLYAGLYLDQQNGGTVVLEVTRDAAVHAAAITPRLPATSVHFLAVVQRPNAMANLEALMNSVNDKVDAAEAAGVVVSSIGIDEVGNKILIGVASDHTDAVRYYGGAFPGAPIEIDDMPRPTLSGVNFTEAPPLRGGQRINYTAGRLTHLCTSSFVAYTLTRTDARIYLYNYFLLTAGHCETDDHNVARFGSAVWQQVGYAIGLSDLNSFVPGSSADALRIPLRQTDKSSEISLAYGLRNLVRCEETASDDVVGEQEAMSGATSGGAVGGVLKIKKEVIFAENERGDAVRLVNQKEADYQSRPGDSGGSVYGNRRCAWQAQGIESTASTRNDKPVSSFTHVSFADAKMGVSIMTA